VPTAVYPGKFDPVHNGHLDIARRASRLFERLIVVVYDSPPKRALFTTDERVRLFAEAIEDVPNVEVRSFSGLATGVAADLGATFIVRGLRAGYDFEIEFEMTHMWRHLNRDIEVVCMMSTLENQFVYASRIKEVAQLGGDVDGLVPPKVAAKLREKFISAS
jgi:pantetheine-phosphate adenylyltransferase